MSQFPTERLSIKGLYAAGFHAWKKIFIGTQWLALLAFLWAMSPYLILPEFRHFQYPNMLVRVLEQGLLAAVYFFGLLILYAAVYHRAHEILSAKKSGFGESLLSGLKKLPILVAAVLISVLALMLGYAALAVPGIYVTLALTFYYPLVVTEDKNPWAAFKECFELIWNRWWRTAAVILVPTIIFALLKFMVDAVFIKLYNIYHPSRGISAIYPHIIRLIMGAFYFPYIVALILMQLNDLKIRKGLVPWQNPK